MWKLTMAGMMLATALTAAEPAIPEKMLVKLNAEVSTNGNKPGDLVVAQVMEDGGGTSTVTGTVKECEKKGMAVEKAVLTIEFDTWHRDGQRIPIHGTVLGFGNGEQGAEAGADGRLQVSKNNALTAVRATETVMKVLGRGGWRPSKKTAAGLLGGSFAAGLVAGRLTSERPEITMPAGTELMIRTR